MYLAYVDELGEENNGVKHLLIRQDLSDRFLYAKRLQTKDSKQTVRAVLTTITERNRLENIWVDKGTKFPRKFKNICKPEGIQT